MTNTDPTLQAVHDDGYATANDDLDMLIAQLADVWGRVFIECDFKGRCIVGDGLRIQYRANTLLAALRLAAAAVEEVQP